MKRALLIVPLVLCAAVAPVGRAHGGPSIVLNGGFETLDETGSPAAWGTAFLPETQEFVGFAADTAVRRSGLRSARLSIDGEHPATEASYSWVQQVPEFETGHQYKLSAFVKTESVATWPVVVVQFLDGEGSVVKVVSTEKKPKNRVTGTSDWTRVKLGFTIPRATRSVVVRASLAAPANKGARVWFDDITIRPL